jgi:hypothetical protein
MTTTQTVLSTAFVVGLIGDGLLNLIISNSDYDWGLKEYFQTHGPLEAMFIASSLMMVTMASGLGLWGGVNKSNSYAFLFVFGCLVDLAFRYLHLMPSLDKMYKHMYVVQSMVWAGGPLVFSLWLSEKVFV